jgi:hypothetical protein
LAKIIKRNTNLGVEIIDMTKSSYAGDNTTRCILKCYCSKCNTCFLSTWKGTSSKINCPNCAYDYIRFSINDIKLYIEKTNNKVYLADEKTSYYRNKMSSLQVTCSVCNNTWYTTYNTLKASGCGCPNCRLINMQGFISTTSAKNNELEWREISSIVYIIECNNDNEVFYKIGITDRSISERFSREYEMPYSYKILQTLNTNKYLSLYIEHRLHQEFKDFWYKPKIKFGGWTECFSYIDLKKINIYIKDEIELRKEVLDDKI